MFRWCQIYFVHIIPFPLISHYWDCPSPYPTGKCFLLLQCPAQMSSLQRNFPQSPNPKEETQLVISARKFFVPSLFITILCSVIRTSRPRHSSRPRLDLIFLSASVHYTSPTHYKQWVNACWINKRQEDEGITLICLLPMPGRSPRLQGGGLR